MSRRNPADLAGACSGGKFDVSRAGEVYDAEARGLNRKIRLKIQPQVINSISGEPVPFRGPVRASGKPRILKQMPAGVAGHGLALHLLHSIAESRSESEAVG